MLIDTVRSYIALRRAAGFGMVNVEPLLVDFAHYACARGDLVVRADTAIAWASRGRSPERRETLIRAVAVFARHARAEDPRHEIPPGHLLGRYYRRPTPFIFSTEQLRRLLEAARRLGPPDSLRPHTYETLFSLLAVTGLRVSEALALRREDITRDGLHIRKTKFQKSRLVPLHPTVATALEHYLDRRRVVGGEAARVFVGADGRPLRYQIVRWTFCQLVLTAGLAVPGRSRPHIHSLRHTFAVRALESRQHSRLSVARHQVALMTYLGHSHLESTYWYLQSTPLLLHDIADACEAVVIGGDL
jgi:integrase/recombinase XerD